MNRLRLLPVVLFALASLLGLKAIDLLGRFGVEVGGPPAAYAGDATDTFARFVANARSSQNDITGSVTGKPPEQAADSPETPPPAPVPVEMADPMTPLPSGSPSERALLERLQQRREQLDQQARDLDMRENLLKAAEKRIQTRLDELKQLQTAVGATQQQEEATNGRMKGLVTMYEAMKPKDAARIFDRLDLAILVDVATAMKPAKLADVLAAMDPDAAQRLTVALANRGNGHADAAQAVQPALDLPKIDGRLPSADANPASAPAPAAAAAVPAPASAPAAAPPPKS